MKKCSKCGESKSLSDFGRDKRRRDGLCPWCKDCRREYRRTTRKQKIQDAQRQRSRDFVAWLASTLGGKPCLDCHEVYPYYVMEFDHVRGEKRYAVSKMANHSRERVLEEIAKCEAVCCACHRIRSHSRREPAKTPRLVAFREWIAPLKANPCRDCGKTLPPEAMDFDHVEGEKVEGIAQMWSHSRERVLEEIAKCELVCANCHKERTWRRIHGAPEDSRPLTCVTCGEVRGVQEDSSEAQEGGGHEGSCVLPHLRDSTEAT
jgi:hypothetical protein